MAKTNNYRINEDIITFSYTFRKPVYFINRGAQPATFTTIYKSCLMTWNLQIENPASWMVLRNLGTKYQIVLQNDGLRDKYPPVEKVEFHLKIFSQDGKNFIKPLSHFIFGHEIFEDPLFSMGHRTPEGSEISKMLTKASNHPDFIDKTFEILTRIDFRVSELNKIENLTVVQARPVPVDLDFRFNSLNQKKCSDFQLKSQNGEIFETNKESLFVSSRWFREILTQQMTQLKLDVDSSESIEIAVTFMFTERYKVPPRMTPKLMKDIVHLACLFGVKRISLLRRALERHCFEEILKNYDDLSFILEMLISSKISGLYNLQNACIASIISCHFSDFTREYVENTPPEYAILRESMNFQRSLISTINSAYLHNQTVTSYVRQTPI